MINEIQIDTDNFITKRNPDAAKEHTRKILHKWLDEAIDAEYDDKEILNPPVIRSVCVISLEFLEP